MRTLGLANAGRRERHGDRIAEQSARRQAARAALRLLDQFVSERNPSGEVAEALRTAHRSRLLRSEIAADDVHERNELSELHDEIDLSLIAAERQHINDLYCDHKLTDEARRRLEKELDLREARVVNSRDED